MTNFPGPFRSPRKYNEKSLPSPPDLALPPLPLEVGPFKSS